MQQDGVKTPGQLDSPFRRRLFMRSSVSRIVRYQGRHISLPLEHRQPPPPFEPRITAAQSKALEAWFSTLEKA